MVDPDKISSYLWYNHYGLLVTPSFIDMISNSKQYYLINKSYSKFKYSVSCCLIIFAATLKEIMSEKGKENNCFKIFYTLRYLK